MKFFITLILCIFCLFCHAQKTVIDKVQYLQRNEQAAVALRKIDSLSKILEKKEVMLNQRVNDSSKTIEYLNSLVNSFGQIFTILGIFIGIIALALPIIMYQFGIKPSQKALKDLEANIDSRLSNYLIEARNKEIDNAINNIKTGPPEQKHKAISYLALTQHEGFTDNQLYKIYSILNKNRSEINIKSQLAYILSNQKNEYAEDLFNEDEINKDPIIKQMAYLYFTKMGFKNHYVTISAVINKSENQYQEFSTFLYNLAQYSSNDVIELFNDNVFIDILTTETLLDIKSNLKYTMESLSISQDVFKNTYLYQKL